MLCALYARKSTDQAGAGDKSESVERLIAHAPLPWATRLGGTRPPGWALSKSVRDTTVQ